MFAHRILHSLLCCSMLLSGTFALAAETAPATADTDNRNNSSLLATKAAYEQKIATIEQQHLDAYTTDLGEACFGLGQTLQALGEHEEANNAFHKSLQAYRTSFGLQDTRQLPVLKALVDSSRTLRKWDEVDSLHHLIYYITSRKFDAGNDLREDATLALVRWKQEAAGKELLPAYEEPVLTAITTLEKEIGYMKAAKPSSRTNLQLAALYLELGSSELMETKHIQAKPIRDYDANGERETVMEQQCESVRGPDGKFTRVCTVTEVPNTGNVLLAKSQTKRFELADHITKMRDAITRAVDLMKTETRVTPAYTNLRNRAGELIAEHNEFMKSIQDTTSSRIAR